MARIIEWTDDGYPTESSLQRLRKALKTNNIQKAKKVFYLALRENHYDWCGPEKIEVRGEVIDVWGYHTGGWSGNEDIISVLSESWLWHYLLERYDSGGHYYFKHPVSEGIELDDEATEELPEPDSVEKIQLSTKRLLNNFWRVLSEVQNTRGAIGEAICEVLRPVLPGIYCTLGRWDGESEEICLWCDGREVGSLDDDMESIDWIINELLTERGLKPIFNAPVGVMVNEEEAKQVRAIITKLLDGECDEYARIIRILTETLENVLKHINVDDEGLNCEIVDECCAGKDILLAKDVLKKVKSGEI